MLHKTKAVLTVLNITIGQIYATSLVRLVDLLDSLTILRTIVSEKLIYFVRFKHFSSSQ